MHSESEITLSPIPAEWRGDVLATFLSDASPLAPQDWPAVRVAVEECLDGTPLAPGAWQLLRAFTAADSRQAIEQFVRTTLEERHAAPELPEYRLESPVTPMHILAGMGLVGAAWWLGRMAGWL